MYRHPANPNAHRLLSCPPPRTELWHVAPRDERNVILDAAHVILQPPLVLSRHWGSVLTTGPPSCFLRDSPDGAIPASRVQCWCRPLRHAVLRTNFGSRRLPVRLSPQPRLVPVRHRQALPAQPHLEHPLLPQDLLRPQPHHAVADQRLRRGAQDPDDVEDRGKLLRAPLHVPLPQPPSRRAHFRKSESRMRETRRARKWSRGKAPARTSHRRQCATPYQGKGQRCRVSAARATPSCRSGNPRRRRGPASRTAGMTARSWSGTRSLTRGCAD
mmetsp:Transcript_33631/g.70546  ORF Transcript_33631/g.70546 Transcript_33631/m.70546 type:complete len:272 (-) Transcript_33631:809-1624(-)